jgi:hypothetical protein
MLHYDFMTLRHSYIKLTDKLSIIEEQIQELESDEDCCNWILWHLNDLCREHVEQNRHFSTIKASEIIPGKLWLKLDTWIYIIDILERNGAQIVRQPLEEQGGHEFIIFELHKHWLKLS